jgi:hypothetical protein
MQDFYRVLSGYEAAANDNAMFICRKLVSDMIYESRILQNWSRRLNNIRKSENRTCETFGSLQNNHGGKYA